MSWEQSKSKSKNEKKGGVIFEVIWPKDRGVGDGWVEWAIARPCLADHLTRGPGGGGQTHYYLPIQI